MTEMCPMQPATCRCDSHRSCPGLLFLVKDELLQCHNIQIKIKCVKNTNKNCIAYICVQELEKLLWQEPGGGPKMASQQLGIEEKNSSEYALVSVTDILTKLFISYNITGCVWIAIQLVWTLWKY